MFLKFSKILRLDKDKFLVKHHYINPGEKFNSLNNKTKNKIIDNLVLELRSGSPNDRCFIALMLIFEAQIKNIISDYYSRFKIFGYSFDDFIHIIATNFYTLTVNDFIPIGRSGHRAKYNRFISKKLHDKIYCTLSKLIIYDRYKIKINSHGNTCGKTFDADDFNRIIEDDKLLKYKDYIIDVACEIFSDYRKNIILDIVDGMAKHDVLDKYNISNSKFTSIIMKVKNKMKEFNNGKLF